MVTSCNRNSDRKANRNILLPLLSILSGVLLLLAGGCGSVAGNMDADASAPLASSPSPTATTAATTAAATATMPSPPATSPPPPPTATLIPSPHPSPTSPPLPTPTASPSPTPSPLPTATPDTPSPPASIGAEILFLREGNLMASDVATGRVRQIAEGVSEFAAAPGGAMLAVIRDSGRSGEIWLVPRDGSEPRQLTSNTRAEGGLSWNNDGTQLTYGSTAANLQRPLTRSDWAAGCGASEIHMIDINTDKEISFEPGCDPAFSPDGRRIAFATPPEQTGPAGQKTDLPNTANTIRLINSKGEHGWSFAVADGETPESGLLVYAPAWSPDGDDLAYQRFLGYQALVDMNYTEIGGSFAGDGSLADVGSGWLLPPRFAPAGLHIAIVEHDAENARGWEGYEQWQVRILRRGETREIPLPDGAHTATASLVERLPRAANVAWSPDSTTLAVLLPPGWQPDVSPNQPHFENTAPGEVWLWEPGRQPSQRIIETVDYASPLLWLPAIENNGDNNGDNNRANQQANIQGNNQGNGQGDEQDRTQ